MRPAPTRFCGYSYMLSREEEVKPSLQRVVVSQQYAAHNFDRQEGGDPAKDLRAISGAALAQPPPSRSPS
eukprot:846937-Prymnesium_polylepis.1